MLDWTEFTRLAADNTSETVTLSADSLTLFMMLLEFAELPAWTEGGQPPSILASDAIEAMVAQAWAEIS